MGAHNNFSPKGRSSYELANLTGCFSYMTGAALQLDSRGRLLRGQDPRCGVAQEQQEASWACLASMINRSGDVGFAQFDSTRCAGGQEITTYDSLDHSLAQTRNNVYIAVKSWGPIRPLALMFRELGDEEQKRSEDWPSRSRASCRSGRGRSAAGDLRKGKSRLQLADSSGSRRLRVSALLRQDRLCRRTLDQVFSNPAERRMFDVLKAHTRICCSIPSGAISLPMAASSSPPPATTRG
jgi:hypothetical protein